jgi:hypothetical protein
MNFLNIYILTHLALPVEKYAYNHEKPPKMKIRTFFILGGFIEVYEATLFSFKFVSRERLKKITIELIRSTVIVT